jgi:hypothetical protein
MAAFSGTTMATMSLIATAASTAITMMGQQAQANAQARSAAYKAAVARNNQQVAVWRAHDAAERGRTEVNKANWKTKQLMGRQRAAQAGMGVVVDEDSAGDIVAETAEFGKLDALNVAANVEREKYGLLVQAQNFESSATLLDMEEKNARQEGQMAMAGSLFDGIGSVSNKWYGFKKERIF